MPGIFYVPSGLLGINADPHPYKASTSPSEPSAGFLGALCPGTLGVPFGVPGQYLDTLFWGLGYSSAGLTGFNWGSRFNPCTLSLCAPAAGPRLLTALLSVSLFSPVLCSAVWSL